MCNTLLALGDRTCGVEIRTAPVQSSLRQVIKSVNGVDANVADICAALFQAKTKIQIKIVRVRAAGAHLVVGAEQFETHTVLHRTHPIKLFIHSAESVLQAYAHIGSARSSSEV